jgi:septum formation protein
MAPPLKRNISWLGQSFDPGEKRMLRRDFVAGVPPTERADEDLIEASEQPRIILASASPRRVQLLREAGLRFAVVPSGEHEPDRPHLTPRELAMRHAFQKARSVAARFPKAIVIGADTIVVLGRRVFNKPRDMADAKRMLRRLQGKTHRVITGVCVLDRRKHRRILFAETTAVTFRKLNAGQIADYLRRIDPLDKAGAYAAQEHGRAIIARVEGLYSNVVGFPVETFLRRAGRWLPARRPGRSP